jgi:hypothetical protein
MSARDLKFEPVQPTLMEHEHVRHARSDAQALQDRGLGRVTVAAIWAMKVEAAGHRTGAQVVEAPNVC